MKAMVLAAGLGERMRPLTELLAKPVLPVLNRPLLAHTLERLARAGVSEAIVNLHHLPATVRAAVGDGRRFGLRVRYSHEARILGTGGGPRAARRWLGQDPILLVNGDVCFDFDLRKLVLDHRRSGAAATLVLRPNPDPRRYPAVISDRRGRILSVRGEPRGARGVASLFAGLHVVAPALFDRLPEGPSDSIAALYIPLLREGVYLRGVRARGAWYDLGRPELYRRAQLALLRRVGQTQLVDPRARVSTRATVRASVVGAGCVVEAGAVVMGSVLWPRVRIGRGARVERSILTSGVTVAPGQRLVGSVAVPGAHGMVVSSLGAA